MRLLVKVDFAIDGRRPTSVEQADIVRRVVTEWPTWEYTYGSKTDPGALLVSPDMRVAMKDQGWLIWYRTYLQSDAWKRKRAKVLKGAGYKCEVCHRNKATNVHHLSYDRVGKNPKRP